MSLRKYHRGKCFRFAVSVLVHRKVQAAVILRFAFLAMHRVVQCSFTAASNSSTHVTVPRMWSGGAWRLQSCTCRMHLRATSGSSSVPRVHRFFEWQTMHDDDDGRLPSTEEEEALLQMQGISDAAASFAAEDADECWHRNSALGSRSMPSADHTRIPMHSGHR